MDFFRIIQQEGYRKEDLSKENQRIIGWLEFLREQMDSFEDNLDDYDIVAGNTAGKIKAEFAHDVIEQFLEWMDCQIAEIQVHLAENEPDEEMAE